MALRCHRFSRSIQTGIHSSSRSFPQWRFRRLMTLAIESSCDDTSVAVLNHPQPGEETIVFDDGVPKSGTRLFFHEKITSNNLMFNGIHPVTALISHQTNVAKLVQKAVRVIPRRFRNDENAEKENFSRSLPIVDFVTVTRGPGMRSNLSVGLDTAKGLSVAWDVPLVAVNHMQAHALTPRLDAALKDTTVSTTSPPRTIEPHAPTPTFPFLSLLVSGGHTLLIASRTLVDHSILADTIDVAIGDCIDKVARDVVPPEIMAQAETTMYGAVLEAFAFPNGEADYIGAVPGTAPQHVEQNDSVDTIDRGNASWKYMAPRTRGEQSEPKYPHRPESVANDPPLSLESSESEQPAPYDWSIRPSFSTRSQREFASQYAFSGIISTIHRIMSSRPNMSVAERRELARVAMTVAFEHLASRVCLALQKLGVPRITEHGEPWVEKKAKRRQEQERDREQLVEDEKGGSRMEIDTLVLSGGVAANKFLRHVLETYMKSQGFPSIRLISPPISLCTDNAAMIAWTGMEMFIAGHTSDLSVQPLRKWALDSILSVGNETDTDVGSGGRGRESA